MCEIHSLCTYRKAGPQMKEIAAQIKTAQGQMGAFITHPEESGPFPAVIIYMDIWGVREALLDVARLVGTIGYYCIVPDWYYREGGTNMVYGSDTDEVSVLRGRELSHDEKLARGSSLSNAMVVDDTGAVLKFIQAGEPVWSGGIGTIGYCMGGRHVMCAAGSFSNEISASACLHGTDLISDSKDSPHLLAGNFRGELYCGFGQKDPYTPPTLVDELNQLLRPLPVRYSYNVHKGADHGYALPDWPDYLRKAVGRYWEAIFAMFYWCIPPYHH